MIDEQWHMYTSYQIHFFFTITFPASDSFTRVHLLLIIKFCCNVKENMLLMS